MKRIRGARVGVFGGSFDPPHLGHALLPAWVRARGLVDRIVVAPCADHPLGKAMSSFPRRLTWTQLAMAPYAEHVEVSDIERQLAAAEPGPSYTLRLLDAIADANPGARVQLIIGSDIVERGETAQWHRWDQIVERYEPIVVPRVGYADPDACALPEISSTAIRAAIQAGQWDEVEAGVPAAVAEHMRRGVQGVVWIVGRGHVAAHAEPWLRGRGYEVATIDPRELAAPEGDPPAAVWILVRDPAIESVARALVGVLPRGVPVLHAAGALRAAEVLAALREHGHPVGTLHPICALRRERPWPPQLPDAAFGVEGDAPARAFADAILGDQPRLLLDDLDATRRRAYHAACALAANHLAVLQASAANVLVGQGHDAATVDTAVQRLLASALDNLLELGIPAGITGPVARGDRAAVVGHLAALDEETAALYRVLSERLTKLVR